MSKCENCINYVNGDCSEHGLETVCGIAYKDAGYCKYQLSSTSNQPFDTDFKAGDLVRLKDGDGRSHIIASINWEQGLRGDWYATVEFDDSSAVGMIWDNGKSSDMEHIIKDDMFRVPSFNQDALIELSNKEFDKIRGCEMSNYGSDYANGIYDGVQIGFHKAKDHILREIYNELLTLRGKDIKGDELLRKFEWKYIK